MRVVILGSGRGSNAEALCLAQQQGRLGRARIVAIFADRPEAGILALELGFERRGIEAVRVCAPDLVVLAGFMRVVKPGFLEAFAGKVINLHPSLLPSFPGLDGIGQAFRHGVKITGCTVHQVVPAIDAGPILDQAAVRIEPTDTLERLATKVHAAEHALLVDVVARLSLG